MVNYVFEYRPRYNIKTSMSVKQLACVTGENYYSILTRVRRMRLPIDGGVISAESCNAILNDKTLRSNWVIENYVNLKTAAILLGTFPTTLKRVITNRNVPCIKQFLKNEGGVWLKIDEVEKLKSYFTKVYNTKYVSDAPLVKDNFVLWLEGQKKKHPLVKDVRCFDKNYFPDSTPLCFQEMEED